MNENTSAFVWGVCIAIFCMFMLVLAVAALAPAHSHELVIASTYNDGTRDANGLTAAHKTLPFGTKLTLKHGHRTTVVTISDRGPFIKGRTLDLTPAVDKYLRCAGLCRVIVEPWPPLPIPRPYIPTTEAKIQWGEE